MDSERRGRKRIRQFTLDGKPAKKTRQEETKQRKAKVTVESRQEELTKLGGDSAISAQFMETTTVENGKFKCLLCRVFVSLKKAKMERHFETTKHKDQLKAAKMTPSMQVHTTDQLVEGRRASSTELLLGAGLPANIMASPLVRSMFEAAFEVSMPHFTHVYEYVPKVLEKEKKALRKELSSGPVALIHDGATVVCRSLPRSLIWHCIDYRS